MFKNSWAPSFRASSFCKIECTPDWFSKNKPSYELASRNTNSKKQSKQFCQRTHSKESNTGPGTIKSRNYQIIDWRYHLIRAGRDCGDVAAKFGSELNRNVAQAANANDADLIDRNHSEFLLQSQRLCIVYQCIFTLEGHRTNFIQIYIHWVLFVFEKVNSAFEKAVLPYLTNE